jgi:integrase
VELADTPDLGSGSVRIGGSSPLARTTFTEQIEGFSDSDTVLTQETAEIESANVKFPKRIKHRGQVLAMIYGKSKGRNSYRVGWYVAGKRQMASFKTYSLAKRHADGLVKDLAKGSQVTALHPAQARDALSALERLGDFYRATGRHVSLLAGISEFTEAATRLNGRSLGEAVEGFLQTVVSVRRKDVSEAVEQFLGERKHKAEAKDGKRSQLSASYEKHVSGWLRGFAITFPATAICDLTKDHLNLYFNPLTEVGTKNRNDQRAVVKMFLSWAVRQDYLAVNHRLIESSGMTRETVETADTEFFRPAELKKLLDEASADLCPALAIAGLAGLRGEEIMRLDWTDVWRVEGHIEITARQAKTRQRRLVEICPALAAWLKPRRQATGKVFPGGVHVFQRRFSDLRDTLKIPARRNGLRHAFCTYHFALHSNENLTAAQAGNSPAMIHAHYKGLATKAEATKWFTVRPARAAKSVILLTTVA